MSAYDGWLHGGLPSPYDGQLHDAGPLDTGGQGPIIITGRGTGLSWAAAEGTSALVILGSGGEPPSWAAAGGTSGLIVTGSGGASALAVGSGTAATDDVTPPVLTWGPVSNADAGERMVVQYSLNEGTVVSAELRIAGRPALPMEVFAGTLELQLPDDTPEGIGEVYARVADQAGNEASYTLQVAIAGTTGTVPVGIAGGMPHPGPELRRGRSRVSVGSTTRVKARARTISSASLVTSSRGRRRLTSNTGAVVTTTTQVGMAQRSEVVLRATASSAVARKAESPSYEDELIAIGVL